MHCRECGEPAAPVPFRIAATDGSSSTAELVPMIRRFERELLARGVEAVQYEGLPEEEIAVTVSAKRLRELDMTLDDRARATSGIGQTATVSAGVRLPIGENVAMIADVDTVGRFEDPVFQFCEGAGI